MWSQLESSNQWPCTPQMSSFQPTRNPGLSASLSHQQHGNSSRSRCLPHRGPWILWGWPEIQIGVLLITNEGRETPSASISEILDSTSTSTLSLSSLVDYSHSTTSELNFFSPTLPHEGPDVKPNTINRSHILLYDTDTAARILTMASLSDEERSLPFLQCIHLMGPRNYSVQATGQVDDGAMKNCISKKHWDWYGHCLSSLHPSTTQIKVANGSKLKPLGRWFGTIRVGSVSASSWFKVFDSHGAFDIILGKPWLKQVKATHDYGSDQLSITNSGTTDTLLNEASINQPKEQEPVPTNTPVMPVNIDTEIPPKGQLNCEWLWIHQIQVSESPWKETQWVAYLDLEPLDTDTNDEDMDSWSTDFLVNLFNDDIPPTTKQE